ncbi:E Centromere protein [Takifugu flavidus]|uniref:Centromere-associated protein E n=1 Tax=Takifugu flavidus TaxID=433684 RepID=A0A5C6P6Z5_9TELE|nr:E Centromere protein [Takifugu flavidus]
MLTYDDYDMRFGEQSSAETTEPVQLFWKADDKSIHLIDDGSSTSKSFCFDRVFTAEETTNHLYQSIAKPLVVSTVQGYNGTIFAYGQTSSGKTFTMMGGGHIPGVIPLAVEDVFQTIKNCPKKEFLLRVSYMEIYNETVTDLLVDTWKRKPLEVRETINKNIFVADLTEEMVTNPAQALSWISKGEKNRHYGKTKMNQRSSRSHTIFRMILESRERSDPASGENADGAIIVSHLNLVDLAGSERASQTGAEGARLKEGCNINRSLFTLGQVIKKLTDENQKGFTNYRDSKLTRILQNSLGGNAKTVIICTITPATLDETLSTLQFASTAKKMKNDPHVTEVSDDGALLKRYRNEIVDLKRRLHEVSSVTQTAATEKKVLSQLLQEKDQLQREQEDRIKNLTKLLVTSSNLVPFKKLPKRRVTWGGPMLRLAQPPACGGSGDLSFAEPFSKKWKPDRSCLSELGEEDEFDSNWEIPEEPSDVLEMSENGVTVRSFEESPKDLFSPDRLHELTGQVSKLEFLLEMESQQKKEAMTRVDELNERLMELEQQLQSEAQQKREALEKNQSSEQRGEELEPQLRSEGLDKTHPSEQRAAELEILLKSEAQQKHEALEKIHSSEQRAAELELQLQSEAQQKHEALEKTHSSEQRAAESWSYSFSLKPSRNMRPQIRQSCVESGRAGATASVRRDFAETIQLCETLASEKDLMVTERDYLKQELGMFLEQIGKLEKENALLSKELQEMKEVEEFESLEEEFRKEHEDVLQNEICDLRRAVEGSELQCQELQNKLESVTVELKKKSDFAEELQTMNGKDLVQEVAELRRSLHDAEGLGRDAKKEWAILRSQNLSLEESVVTLTASHNKMEAEVSSLRHQLSVEKSHNKQMQTDLQKELTVAFDENTKLTALLDGKVPKNLIDAVELERSAANLTKELTASREAEEALRGQLASLQVLPDQVQHLGKQLEQSEQQKLSLEEKINEMQQLLKDLEEKLVDSENSRQTEEEISKELQEQLNELNRELQCERAEKEQNVHSSTETERLISSLTAERDQIRAELQDNVEKAAEAQAVLHSVQDDIQHHRQKNADLMKLSEQKDSDIENLSRELQRVCDELAEARRSGEEERQLQPVIDSLTAEQDQQGRFATLNREKEELQEIIDVLRQEKQQLKAELEDRLVAGAQGGFAQAEMLSLDQQSHEEEIEQLQTSLQAANDQRIQLEDELQRNSELTVETPNLQNALQLQEKDQRNTENERMSQQREAQLEQQIIEIQCHFGRLEEELLEQKQKMSDNMKLWEQKESDLEQQRTSLTEQLESAQSERDALMLEKDSRTHTYTEEKEELHRNLVTLSKDREELQEMVEMLRQEKQQLRTELEDRMEMMQFEFQQQQLGSQTVSLKEEQEDQQLVQLQQLQQHLESSKEEVNQLKSDLEENVELMIENQEELRTAQKEIRGLEEEIRVLRHQKSELEERQLKCFILSGQIQCLKEELLNIKAERDALWSEKDASCSNSLQEKSDLQSRLTSLTEEKEELQSRLVALGEDKEALQNSLISLTEEKEELQSHLTSLSKEKEELHSHLASLVEKKEDVKSSLLSLTEEKEELQSRLMALGEDKEALQSSVQSLSKEKEELQSRLMALGEDKVDVKSSLMSLTEEKEELQSRLVSLCEEKEALQNSLVSLSGEKEELQSRLVSLSGEKEELQSNLTSLSEEREEFQKILEMLRQEKQHLQAEMQERVDSLQTEISTVNKKMDDIKTERDGLMSEKEASCWASSQEQELQSRLTSLREEKEEMSELLEMVKREEQQLRTEMKCKLVALQTEAAQQGASLQMVTEQKKRLENDLQQSRDMVRTLTEKLQGISETSQENEEMQNRLASLGIEKEELQVSLETLQQEKQQLTADLENRMETISALQQTTDGGEREAELQQLLVEANSSIAALQDQLDRLIKNPMMSQLQDSNKQIQEFLGTFQQFIEACSRMKVTVQNEILRVKNPCPKFVPKSSRKSYSTVCQLRIQTLQCLLNTMEYLQEQAQVYRNLFEDLLKKDRLTFEEKCLQDVLLCRDQTYSFSVRDEDFNKLWRYRLTELLDKRNVYMKKMQTIWEKLWANMSYFTNELSAEVREHESFKEQLQAKVGLDQILGGELQRRSTMVETRNIHLQQLREENSNMCEELKCLQVQNDSELREERSRRCSMLQEEVQGAAFDTQQLLLKLQQAEDKVRLMNAEKQQLEKDQLQVHGRLSSHKEATQLLQTELQDSRAQVQDQDNTIQTLRNQLEEAQKNASPSAEELEHLRSKLLRADLELSSASEQHQKEIQKFKVLLNTKEESVRKLKELLRKSQQHGEESILQGEDLHARLTNPKGLNIRTSIAAEKAKLEEEVQQLQLKISELESQVSCQAAELSKWKSRAIKLKAKTKPELDKPGSPCTPTKRGLCSTTESSHLLSSPKRKVLDSPKSSALDSPKSRFFDVGGTSDLLSRTFPKQFFDNSNLGLPQAVDKNDEWWPRSPKQEDMCKTQ